MCIEVVPHRKSLAAVHLREGWREGKKTRKKRTSANLSDWPRERTASLRCLLREAPLVSPQDLFHTQQTLAHVHAILSTVPTLGLEALFSAHRCRERDLVVAVIGERLIHPHSNLAATRECIAPHWPRNWELLEATEKGVTNISQEVARRNKKPLREAENVMKVGKGLGRSLMSKHFDCTIEQGSFRWPRREVCLKEEAQLDAIYVLRTSESAERIPAEDAVRSYKRLSDVERAFHPLGRIGLSVRLVRHRDEHRVEAYFLCAYWLTTWNGICARLGHYCCLTMRIGRKSENGGIPSCRRNPRNRPNKRREPEKRRIVFPCTALRP
jgi:hypothetical protein